MQSLNPQRGLSALRSALRLPAHKRRWTALAALLLLLALTLDADAIRRTPTEEAIVHDRFGLVEWIGLNLLEGVQDALLGLLPGGVPFESERRAALDRYFDLGDRVRRIEGLLALAVAQGGAEHPQSTELQAELERLRRERDSLRDLVELTINEAVSDALRAEGLERTFGPLRPLFPPVSFKVTRVPKLIVVSPRDRIANQESRLLEPDITPMRMEELEEAVGPEQDRSAVVTRIGGVATYPALISDSQSLRSAVRTIAHEWLHHYWFFHPLGQGYFSSPEMATLNETAADLAGNELGDLALVALGEELPPPPAPAAAERESAPAEPPAFDFATEMRETRLHTDELLANGKVDEAEAYMEERRLRFVEHGYPIRVLNQAYFAFHGTYGESPASSSPIGPQVRRFREHTDSVGDFVRRIREFSSYREFIDYLDTLPPEDG